MRSVEMISVWGSPASGKTTIASLLAKHISKSQNVILVHADCITPTLPINISVKGREKRSLGNILSAVGISDKIVLKQCCVVENNHNLAVLGFDHQESIFTYPQYYKSSVVELITRLKLLCDVIIVDCSTDIGNDMFSTVCLELADVCVRVCTAQPKSMLYFDSTMTFLQDSKFHMHDHIKVLNITKEFEDVSLAQEKYNGVHMEIKYEERMEIMMLEGSLITKKNSWEDAYMKRLLDVIYEPDEDMEINQGKLRRNIKKLFTKKGEKNNGI